MESLKTLLNHPAFVRDAIAKEIYEIADPAEQKKNFVKLRDRALGNLRFQEEEVNALLKIFTALARKIERKVEKLNHEKAEKQGVGVKKIDIIKLLDFPTINLKPLFIQIGKNLPFDLSAIPAEKQDAFLYQSVYDQLRERTTKKDQLLSLLAHELSQLALFITTQLDQARTERKTYVFGKQYKKKEEVAQEIIIS